MKKIRQTEGFYSASVRKKVKHVLTVILIVLMVNFAIGYGSIISANAQTQSGNNYDISKGDLNIKKSNLITYNNAVITGGNGNAVGGTVEQFSDKLDLSNGTITFEGKEGKLDIIYTSENGGAAKTIKGQCYQNEYEIVQSKSLATTNQIVFKNTAEFVSVKLNGVNMKSTGKAIDLQKAKAKLNLSGTNTIDCGGAFNGIESHYIGIRAASDSELTIDGSGSFEVKNPSEYGVGIGGYYNGGRGEGAGIIRIQGGTLNVPGKRGAAIGSGYFFNDKNSGSIYITGGTVNAINKKFGAAIGGSQCGKPANVYITGGMVKAEASDAKSAAIGIGTNGENGGKVVISGGTISTINNGKQTINPTPTNEYDKPVYYTTAYVGGIYGKDASVNNASITDYNYGFKDVKTDANGVLHLYLPVSAEGTETKACFNNESYSGIITSEGSNALKALLNGTGTQEDPYIIKTANDLSCLANSVRAGQNYSGEYFKLDNDITYSSMPIGCFTEGSNTNSPFCGNFDGVGHTVTLAMTNNSSGMQQAVALFGYLGSGASVKNISTTGTITSSGKFSGGIVGVAGDGDVNISNCRSNVEMDFTTGGDSTYGGIVGLINDSGKVTMTNCCFTGKIITTSNKGLEGVGGLCGWKSDTLNAVNCYVDASFVSSSISAKGKYMSRNGGNFINCYYNKEKTLTDDNPANSTGIEAVTSDFTSGKIVWLLQNGQSNSAIQAWGQTLTGDKKDSDPVLSSDPTKAVHKVSYYQDNKELENSRMYVNSSMTLPTFTLTEEEKNQGYRYNFKIASGIATLDTANNQLKDIGGDVKVTVTKKNVTDEQSATVIFKSYYGQEMSKSQLGSSDTITLPEGPTRYGYTFTGWSMTAEDIQKQIAAGTKVIKVEAVYALKDKSYNITVTDGAGDGTYKQNDVVTAIANPQKEGMKFSHWTDKSNNILSYNTTYQFYAIKSVEIKANYVADTAVVEKKGIAQIIDIDKDAEKSKLIFVSMVTVPKGCKIHNAGIIGTDKETVGKSGDRFNKDTAVYTRGDEWTGNAYQFTWTKKVSADQTWYVRSYVEYEDTNGKSITVYGDIISAKLNN